jgi:hypothetical protein
MDLSTTIRRLRASGAHVEIPSTQDVQGHVDIIVDGWPVELKTFHREPTPFDIRRMLRRSEPADQVRLLVFTRRITPALAELAMENPRLIVVSEAEVIRDGRYKALDDQPQTAQRPQPGPRPYARFAIGRALLALDPRASQRAIAAAAGVTQGAVSQSIVTWRSLDRAELFDTLVRNYPGPGGVETFWWHDAPLRKQGETIATTGALISGDLAVATVRPWRVPERIVAYARHPIDLSRSGFVLATPGDYTVRLVAPQDQTLWATAAAFGREGFADPVIGAYDVLRTATTGDADQAVEMVREVVALA